MAQSGKEAGHVKKQVRYDGQTFDSNTEVEFYKLYGSKFKRNEHQFNIGYGQDTDVTIGYTPDFIHKTKPLWIEIKGVKDAEFSLREKLAKEYCANHNIEYYLLFGDKVDSKFKTEKQMKSDKGNRMTDAQTQLKELGYLGEDRKTLEDGEYIYMSYILIGNNKFSYLRNGQMIDKARYFNQISAKIKRNKLTWKKLKQLHLDYKMSKQS